MGRSGIKSPTAAIHFETRRANKTRWVKQAQREGMKLSDWITHTLNEASQKTGSENAQEKAGNEISPHD